MNQTAAVSDFSSLIEQHSARGFNFALRLTGNEQIAKDLLQQTFANALRCFNRYQHSRPFGPWFNRILKNIFIDDMRKLKYRRTVSLDGPSPIEDVAWGQLIPGPDHTPLEQLEKLEKHKFVRKALALLPPAYKVPVTLCDVQGHSYLRIAEILNCPLGTVRSRIHQGRILLRENFEKLAACN